MRSLGGFRFFQFKGGKRVSRNHTSVLPDGDRNRNREEPKKKERSCQTRTTVLLVLICFEKGTAGGNEVQYLVAMVSGARLVVSRTRRFYPTVQSSQEISTTCTASNIEKTWRIEFLRRKITSSAPQLMRAVPSTCGAKRAWTGCSLGSWRFMLTMGPSNTTWVLPRWDTTSWMLIATSSSTAENKQEIT